MLINGKEYYFDSKTKKLISKELINNIKLKLTNKLINLQIQTETSISNSFLADCVNNVINEMVETNNKILEIE